MLPTTTMMIGTRESDEERSDNSKECLAITLYGFSAMTLQECMFLPREINITRIYGSGKVRLQQEDKSPRHPYTTIIPHPQVSLLKALLSLFSVK
jgi:hypothetical protein